MEDAIDKEASASSTSPEENDKSVPLEYMDATAIPEDFVTNRWQVLANRLIGFIGAEARGIERVDETLRMARTEMSDYYDMTSIWFSVNLTVNICTSDIDVPVTDFRFHQGQYPNYRCSRARFFRTRWSRFYDVSLHILQFRPNGI